ncbi:MAG: CBS domain-containing protein [Candidatus Altiarchaeota archaeon]|nr:CBS domain-containing protein [Candidatus Altiarchaeota archaeon]
MTKKVQYVKDDIMALEAAKLMAEKNISSLILLHDKSVSGIVTEKDFLKRVVIAGLDAGKIPVKRIMSTPVETISENADIDEAARVMRDKKIKKLVVTGADNSLSGIVTSFDVIVAQPAMKLFAED